MKTQKLVNSVVGFGLLSTAFAVSATPVNLVFVVEPAVYASNSSESVAATFSRAVSSANKEFASFGVSYEIGAVVGSVSNNVTELVSSGTRFTQAFGPTAYSIGKTESEFLDEYGNVFDNYDSGINPIVDKYAADHIVYVVAATEGNVVGQAFENRAVVVDYATLAANDVELLAHELGHLYGLSHPSSDECASNALLMCQGVKGSGFSRSDTERLTGVVAGNADYLIDWWDSRFWNGGYAASIQKAAVNVRVSVADNPVPYPAASTEVTVELLDNAGAPAVFNHPVSLELFTAGSSAVQGVNYSGDFLRRIEFAPGESNSKVTLSVTPTDTDVALSVGTRYGLELPDSATVAVTIKAKPGTTPKPDPEPTPDAGSGGGAVGFLWLLLVPFVLSRRKI